MRHANAPRRPSRAELLAAAERTVPDVIAAGLRVLFCGINPGLDSAFTGHHFARPGNRFWPALQRAGFTERVLAPAEEQQLLACGCGITNLVERASATAAELTAAELATGAGRLADTVQQYRPAWLAVLGVGAYRSAFGRPRAGLGPQVDVVNGTRIWVLPNPSGLNAHYSLAALAALYAELRTTAERDAR